MIKKQQLFEHSILLHEIAVGKRVDSISMVKDHKVMFTGQPSALPTRLLPKCNYLVYQYSDGSFDMFTADHNLTIKPYELCYR